MIWLINDTHTLRSNADVSPSVKLALANATKRTGELCLVRLYRALVADTSVMITPLATVASQ